MKFIVVFLINSSTLIHVLHKKRRREKKRKLEL